MVCICFHLQGCAEILAQIERQGDDEVSSLRLRDTALLEALLDAHMEPERVVVLWMLVGSRGKASLLLLLLAVKVSPPLLFSTSMHILVVSPMGFEPGAARGSWAGGKGIAGVISVGSSSRARNGHGTMQGGTYSGLSLHNRGSEWCHVGPSAFGNLHCTPDCCFAAEAGVGKDRFGSLTQHRYFAGLVSLCPNTFAVVGFAWYRIILPCNWVNTCFAVWLENSRQS